MTTASLSHYNQNKRSIRIHTHLGKDALMLSSLTLNETLSAPFCYHAVAFSLAVLSRDNQGSMVIW